MLMRFDPFNELDRLTQQAFGGERRSPMMPMDAYREGEEFVVHFDVPGVDPSSIDLTVEKNVLTISARRHWEPSERQQVVASERPHGTFTRQLFLGEGLDTDQLRASYDHGVLTVTVPIAEQAKARRVEVSSGDGQAKAIAGRSA